MKHIRRLLFLLLILQFISVTLSSQAHKCQPNQNMKYDLNHTHQLKGYHSMCSQFAKRTCCSGKNFDSLAKKISSKLITPTNQQHQLSLLCRRKLTTILCSTCDGDIGQKTVQGVCNSLCLNVYESCKDDYFSIDSLNKIKVCRDDDIICSKLKDIIPDSSNSSQFCQLFGIKTAQHECWNGLPSSQIKGVPKRKINYHPKPHRGKKQSNKSFLDTLLRIDTKYWVYIGLVSFLLSILAYKWLSIKLQNEGRKIKNL